MRISFIGAGRVAHHLARALKDRHKLFKSAAGNMNMQTLARLWALKRQRHSVLTEIDLLIICCGMLAIADVIQSLFTMRRKSDLRIHPAAQTLRN